MSLFYTVALSVGTLFGCSNISDRSNSKKHCIFCLDYFLRVLSQSRFHIACCGCMLYVFHQSYIHFDMVVLHQSHHIYTLIW